MSKPVVLVADSSCKVCKGRGYFWENHGPGMQEQLECDCPFQDLPDVFEITNKIENGDYTIVSSAKYLNSQNDRDDRCG